MRVCIIDDDMVSQFATRYCIEQTDISCSVVCFDSGYQFFECYNGSSAPDLGLPDIILLDLGMPNLNGWDFLKEFERLFPKPGNTQIYILSAFQNAADRILVKDHPLVQGYFNKPISKVNMQSIFQAI